eukprot:TRINITY_DN5091_c0_g2_i1.p1 TRINITY_DN5091_c0_g2~~TRINITY_DN5091_c0_g2_i1.p1  ORF type:complete len:636 (+),score=111.56 TRINITY_DN5091_c0_g2_i1:170-2077(+)
MSSSLTALNMLLSPPSQKISVLTKRTSATLQVSSQIFYVAFIVAIQLQLSYGRVPNTTLACETALDADGPHADFSGASAREARDMSKKMCNSYSGFCFTLVTVTRQRPKGLKDIIEETGACLPHVCCEALAGVMLSGGSILPVDSVSEMADPSVVDVVKMWLQKHVLKFRCRDGHPTVRHLWPAWDNVVPQVKNKNMGGIQETFTAWIQKASERIEDARKLTSVAAVDECPAVACATLAWSIITSETLEMLENKIVVSMEDVDGGLASFENCNIELTTDVSQLALFAIIGFNLGFLEIAEAKLKEWLSQRKQRNPHDDDNRLIWRDYYSGLYKPVDYSQQFDLQWRLAFEKNELYKDESSVRLDDCAINDMIQSTFGERDFLSGCTAEARKEHAEKEKGISSRNFMFIDIEEYREAADVLDVGCGFGRWTAMMTRIGARVTSVDASAHAVKSTRRYNPDRTYQMTLFDLPKLPDFEKGFKLVICWGVMQHTHDPLTAFKTVASAVRDGGILFIQVYNDQSKAAYPFTQDLRRQFHAKKTVEEQLAFLRRTHSGAGADIFDHLDGMLTFYNWAVHEDTIKSWFSSFGFADFWRVWNYKYMGRKRSLQLPVRDDSGQLLTSDLGEKESGIRYYPAVM